MKENNNTQWHVKTAKRSFARMDNEAVADIHAKIAKLRQSLDEVERRMFDEQMPDASEIILGSAELEMALARLKALRDIAPAFEILADASNAALTAATSGETRR